MKIKLICIAVLISASVFGQNVPSYVPTNGLVGWWPFNGNANDESGNGNNGTVNGATLTSDRNGISNAAYNFDGDDDFILLNSLVSNPLSEFTISAWVVHGQETGTDFFNIISSNDSVPQNKFQWGVSANQPLPQVYFGSGSSVSATTLITRNNWENLLIVKSTQTLSFYRNGSLDNSLNSFLTNLPQMRILGRQYSSSNSLITREPWNGKLDDIGIWNRALTQQEITALYLAQNCNGGNTITPDGPTTFCAGNSVKMTSSAVGATYQWQRNGVNISGATSRRYTAIQGGSYTCVATCNGTPVTSNTIQLTWLENKPVTLSAAGNTAFCVGDSVTLNVSNPGANYSIQWYRTNISLPSQTGTSLVVIQPGTYKVVTRNNLNGCSRISSSGITTTSNCRTADREVGGGVSEDEELSSARFLDNENSQGVKIYPNPNQGRFRFEYRGHESGSATVQVINSMGQQLHEQRVEVIDGLLDTDIQLNGQFTSGIYIVRMILNGGMHDSRMVVE